MDFFKSIFSDDHDSEEDRSNSQTTLTASPISQSTTNPNPEPNPNPNPDLSTVTTAWSLGSTLFKTIASKSESVIGTYRRDLEEFSSGLKKETAVIRQAATRAVKDLPGSFEAGAAVAQESLESVGQAIDNLTDIIAHGKDSLLANDDYDRESSDFKQIGSVSNNLNVSSKPYSRVDALIRAVECDLNTYCKEVEEVEEFNEWRLGFVLDERGEEIENLIEENGVIEEIYNEIVPAGKVDEETFWARLLFRIYKVKKAEEARTKLVNRAISGEEEELSWDVDDEDYEEYELKQEEYMVKDSGERSDVEGIVERGNYEEGGVSKLKSDGVVDQEVRSTEEIGSCVDKKAVSIDEKRVLEGETDIKDGEVDQIASSEQTGSCVDKQAVSTDEKIISEGKTDSDISVISSQLSPEEDLGWDEIEDIGGSSDDHKVSADGSLNKADLRKRLSVAADEEEDLTWDIEDDDEPDKS